MIAIRVTVVLGRRNVGVTTIHTPPHRGSGVSVYPTPGGI